VHNLKVEIRNRSWAVQDTGVSRVFSADVASPAFAPWRRWTNAENEKSPSMTGFLFMSPGPAGVFEFDHYLKHVDSVSRLLAEFETF